MHARCSASEEHISGAGGELPPGRSGRARLLRCAGRGDGWFGHRRRISWRRGGGVRFSRRVVKDRVGDRVWNALGSDGLLAM